MSTHNIHFYGELSKIILQLSPNTLLIWSTAWLLHVKPHYSDFRTVTCIAIFLAAQYLEYFEPCHEIMVLFVLHKLILQTRMCSHPVGLDVWFKVWLFVYFHTSCVRTAKALERLCRLSRVFTGRLCDKYHNLMSWLIDSSFSATVSVVYNRPCRFGRYQIISRRLGARSYQVRILLYICHIYTMYCSANGLCHRPVTILIFIFGFVPLQYKNISKCQFNSVSLLFVVHG